MFDAEAWADVRIGIPNKTRGANRRSFSVISGCRSVVNKNGHKTHHFGSDRG